MLIELLFGLGFLVAVLVSTRLLKKYAHAETYLGCTSILRSSRLTGLIIRAKWLGPFVSAISTIGFILGFGVFAADFLYGRKRRLPARLLIAAATAACLYVVYLFTIFSAFEIAPSISAFSAYVAFAFSVFGIAGFMVVLLAISAFGIISRFLLGQPSCPSVAPLLPGIQLPQVPYIIPLYAWIGIFFAMILHEASHGIKALHEMVKVKSSGILLFGFLPLGAFVEPDEEMLKAVSEKARMGVFSAGPSANLFSMIPVFAVLLLVGWFFAGPAATALENAYLQGVDHVEVSAVLEKLPFCGNPPSPAYGKLETGMRILQVNDINIRTITDVARATALKPFKESKFVVLDLNGQTRAVYITPHQETNTFGFDAENKMKEGFALPEKETNDYFWAYILYDIIRWIFMISFLLATANFLPIPAFDGGQIAAIVYTPLLAPLVKSQAKREKIIKYFFLAFLLALLIINAAPFFL
ncbi:MAG: site-2 protease family protein [Candidatus Diapherotrites archaeon]|nr:site-2 protease family protein [Candidatus Diapherotrites archaeon]